MESYLYINDNMGLPDRGMALRAKFGPWPTFGSPWKFTFLGYDPIGSKDLL